LEVDGFSHTAEASFSLCQPERELKAFRFLTQVLTSKPGDSVLMADHFCDAKPKLSLPR